MKYINVEDESTINIEKTQYDKTNPCFIFNKEEYSKTKTLVFKKGKDVSLKWVGKVKFPSLEKLEFLHSGFDIINSFSNNAYGFENLTSICFENNKISDIPEFVYSALKLNYITFWFEELHEIPPKFFELSNLKSICIKGDLKIKIIPDEIIKLKRLKWFNLEFAELDYVTPEIFNLPKETLWNISFVIYKPLENLLKERYNLSVNEIGNTLITKKYKNEIIEIANNFKGKYDESK
jgi:hypothetical protein